MPKHYLIYLFLVFFACKSGSQKPGDPAVARVYDKYLYKSELDHIVPKGISGNDSAALVKDHIDKWVRRELLMHQAEENLSPDEKNVEQQIEDYRASLLIFKYEQNYIKQKIDTVVSDKDVADYYKKNSSNFIINNPLVKGIFVIVPKTAPDIEKVRHLYRSDDQDDIKALDSYCYNYATKYEYFDEHWIYFNEILRYLPTSYIRPEDILKYHKHYEVQDSLNYYFLKINSYQLAGSVAPLEFVTSDIKSILLNKRKIKMIQELESNIYNNALNRNNFTIYTKK